MMDRLEDVRYHCHWYSHRGLDLLVRAPIELSPAPDHDSVARSRVPSAEAHTPFHGTRAPLVPLDAVVDERIRRL
jgi:hypothetical protein